LKITGIASNSAAMSCFIIPSFTRSKTVDCD
jgi:hypothetical protein